MVEQDYPELPSNVGNVVSKMEYLDVEGRQRAVMGLVQHYLSLTAEDSSTGSLQLENPAATGEDDKHTRWSVFCYGMLAGLLLAVVLCFVP
jgi:hypothetical protein